MSSVRRSSKGPSTGKSTAQRLSYRLSYRLKVTSTLTAHRKQVSYHLKCLCAVHYTLVLYQIPSNTSNRVLFCDIESGHLWILMWMRIYYNQNTFMVFRIFKYLTKKIQFKIIQKKDLRNHTQFYCLFQQEVRYNMEVSHITFSVSDMLKKYMVDFIRVKDYTNHCLYFSLHVGKREI